MISTPLFVIFGIYVLHYRNTASDNLFCGGPRPFRRGSAPVSSTSLPVISVDRHRFFCPLALNLPKRSAPAVFSPDCPVLEGAVDFYSPRGWLRDGGPTSLL